ncbi:MAG: hypothetical protein JSS87_12830 [Acidobacteria bacterium]|nr:hypothetical protein [Acidobacteriota bacterium]
MNELDYLDDHVISAQDSGAGELITEADADAYMAAHPEAQWDWGNLQPIETMAPASQQSTTISGAVDKGLSLGAVAIVGFAAYLMFFKKG